MKANNSFKNGLSSDVSNLKSSDTTYLSAENFRLVSLEGQSTYALENTKGTSVAFKLPDTVYAIYKIDPQNPLYAGNVNIQINSNFGGPHPIVTINNIQNYSAKQLAEELLANTTILSQVNNGYYSIEYNNNYVVLIGLNNPIVPLIAYGGGAGVSPELLVAEISNTNIIGAINVEDKVVIFSTEHETQTTIIPDSTGQIWVVEYDEDTNTISGLVNNTLVPSVHLKYHHNLGFSRFHKVSGEGRYETSIYQPVHFTDNQNYFRIFNIAATNSFATPLEVLDVKPLHSTTVPVIQSISDGGFIPNGRIQYFYQLLSNLGTVTTYSAASNLISLSSSPLTATYQAYQGGSQGTVSGKSVKIKIEDLDTNYDSIKIGYILWEAEDAATVKLFYEGSIPPSGEVEVTHSGSGEEISSTLEFYRSLQAAFDICKGVVQKKNILLAYNTRNVSFDVDIDCRAYRFSGITANGTNLTNAPDRTAYLYNKEDTYGNPSIIIDGATGIWYLNGVAQGTDWTEIPKEHDLLNPYNFENPDALQNPLSNGDWYNNSQFKYKADGTTLGGEGPIVSYEFITSPAYDVDTLVSTSTTGTTFGNPLSGVISNVSGTSYSPGNGLTYPIPSGLNSSKNPYISEIFNGYARGEVYRFANVFHGLRFQHSFAQWIGDIKFPLNTDSNALNSDFYAHNFDGTSWKLTKKELGIKISINSSLITQSVKDSISGWSYIRVKRTENTKTRLGTGILNYLSVANGTHFCNTGVSGTGFGNADIISFDTSTREYGAFECPNFKFNRGNNFIPGDHIRRIGYLGWVMNGLWGPATTPNNSGVTKYYYRYYSPIVPEIIELRGMLNAEVAKNTAVVQNDINFPYPFINMAEVSGSDWDCWGGYTHILSTRGTGVDLLTNSYPVSAPWNPGFGGRNVTPVSSESRPYVSYERYLSNQYGIQWETRMGQQYIGTNHFQTWNNTLSGIITSEVFGGDTLCSHFGFMKFDANDSTTSTISGYGDAGNPKWQVQFFPCEVDFDLELRQGYHVAMKEGHSGEPYHDEYIYNTAYSQQNTSQIFLTKPYNFIANEENRSRIWASQEKFDGEFPNAWGDWRADEYIDVEGSFGGINSMNLITDKPIYYQDYAVGWVSVKEQVTISPENQAATVLGTGEVLARYDYISKITGSKHQWAVIQTPKGLYHFDATLKKMFFLQDNGNFALSDLKGINSFLQKNLLYSVKDLDIPLIKGGISIHGEYNPRFNQVLFTVLDGYNERLNAPGVNTGAFTISYNELLDCYDSLHSFLPSMYHRTENRLWSIHPKSDSNLYSKTMFEHDTGTYNTYYGVLYPSKLTFVINPAEYSSVNKRLDVLEFLTQINTIGGIDVSLQTVSTIRVFNSYQDTGVITLTPQVNIKKKFRTWKFNTLRDNTTAKPRLRSRTFTVELTLNNPNNNRMVLHDIVSNFEITE